MVLGASITGGDIVAGCLRLLDSLLVSERVGEWISIAGMVVKEAFFESVGVGVSRLLSLTSLRGSRMVLCGSSSVISLMLEDIMSESLMDMPLCKDVLPCLRALGEGELSLYTQKYPQYTF